MPPNQDLTQGDVSRHLVRMTVPMFLGIASMIVASMIETVYIGILGADELAAYSYTFPLMMGLSSVSMGIGSGAASIIARAVGTGDREQVKRIASHAMIATTVLVLVLMCAGLIFLEPFFIALGTQAELLPLVTDYMFVWLLGLPMFALPMVASTALRAVGNARVPGVIITSTSAVQVVLSPLLLFGLLGFPELGLVGSAWASIASGVIRTAAMFGLFFGVEKLLVDGRLLSGFVRSVRLISYIAIPAMLNSLMAPVSMGVIIWLLAAHGPEVVAGYGITSRFEMLVMMILMSLSASVGPFVGQNFGARQVERIYEGLNITYRFCLAWGVVSCVLLIPFGDDLVALISDDPKLIAAAGGYLAIVPVSFAAMGVAMMSGSLFIAIGKPVPTTLLALLRMVIVYLPLAMLFNVYWGYIGIFVATLIANLVTGVVAYFWSNHALRGAIALLPIKQAGE